MCKTRGARRVGSHFSGGRFCGPLTSVSRLRPALWQDRLMLQLLGFIIDCPDPMKLAAFYSQVTGRAIMDGSSGDFAGITVGEVDLAFQRVEDYRPPRWPDDEHPKQFHLDFEVDEIEPEQRRVVELGATLQKDFTGPGATAGRSTPTRRGIPSACAATKGSRGPAMGWSDLSRATFQRRRRQSC